MDGNRSCDLLSILQSRVNILRLKCEREPGSDYLRGQLFAMETALEDVRADMACSIVGPKELLSA